MTDNLTNEAPKVVRRKLAREAYADAMGFPPEPPEHPLKPTSPRTEAGRTLVQRMLSSKTDDRMGPDDLQRAILAIEREAAAATPPEPHRDYAGRTCTTGLLHSHEAAGTDSPATPSLDWSRVITAVANTMPDDDTFARPEVVAAEYARLDEGSKDSGRPNAVAASATPPRIREVVGQGDGTMIVTLDDGTERRITEQEYLDWPRDEGSATPDPVWDDIYGEDGTAGSATPDQGKGEPR